LYDPTQTAAAPLPTTTSVQEPNQGVLDALGISPIISALESGAVDSWDAAKASLGLYTNPNTGNLAITDAAAALLGEVTDAAGAVGDAATKGVLTIVQTLEIILGLTAVIVLGVLVFRYGPSPKKD
jgi:hypothetical protein